MSEAAASNSASIPARSRRRWLRFSLRTMLIVITVACLVGGWWANRLHRRHEAIETIRQYGTELYLEINPEKALGYTGGPVVGDLDGPPWLRDWFGEFAFTQVEEIRWYGIRDDGRYREEALASLRRLPELKRLEIHFEEFNDDDLVHLARLENLESLDLSGTSVTGSGLSHLAGLRNLKELNFILPGIDDAELTWLAELENLEVIHLAHTDVTDASLAMFRGMPRLKRLGLAGTLVEGRDLSPLAGLNLENLDLRYTPLRESALEPLREMTSLKELNLVGCWELGDAAVAASCEARDDLAVQWEPAETVTVYHGALSGDGDFDLTFFSGGIPIGRQLARLPRLSNLQEIHLWSRDATDADLAPLAEMPQLRYVELNFRGIDGSGLRHLAGLEGLERLDLSESSVEGASLIHLAELPNLLALNLGDTLIDDASLAHLAGIESLQYVGLMNTQITDEGLRYLATLPNLRGLMLAGTGVRGERFEQMTCDNLQRIDLRSTPVTGALLESLSMHRELKEIDLRGCWNVSETQAEEFKASPWNKAKILWDPLVGRTEFALYDERARRDVPPIAMSYPLEGIADTQLIATLVHAAELQTLDLVSGEFGDEDLWPLHLLQNLRVVNLEGAGITSAGTDWLQELPLLEELDLSFTDIDDQAIENLAACSSLKHLRIERTLISPAGLARLREALPACRIEHSIRDPNEWPPKRYYY